MLDKRMAHSWEQQSWAEQVSVHHPTQNTGSLVLLIISGILHHISLDHNCLLKHWKVKLWLREEHTAKCVDFPSYFLSLSGLLLETCCLRMHVELEVAMK